MTRVAFVFLVHDFRDEANFFFGFGSNTISRVVLRRTATISYR